MAEKFFAFESGEVSIAFVSLSEALGDTIIAKSVFDALAKLAPNCKIDIFYLSEAGKNYFEAFYGSSKNLNRILNYQKFYAENARKYDLALSVWHRILIESANVDRLRVKAPELLKGLHQIILYNQKCPPDNVTAVILRNMTRAHIQGINRYTSLACEGALPIYDDHVEISLTPEGEAAFQKLNLNPNYITVGSNLLKDGKSYRHALKEWPVSHMTEYISMLNIQLPQIEVVQLGGGGVYLYPNADRQILDADMELVKCVLKNSLLHVDCESGLVHLATQLGTKCLVLFGPTDEKHVGFKQNLNLVSDFCRPCYFAWDNGSTCLRGAKEPPCMLSFTPQLVCDVTCNYINHLVLKNNT